MNELRTALRQFISDEFLFGVETEFADSDSLLENSIIDSTGVLELIMHVETTYDIAVKDDELVLENLDSIENLARFIEKKCSPDQATAG